MTSPVRKAIAALAGKTARGELDVFTAKPFRRATIMKALFAELGVTPKQWCCADEISSLGLDVEPLEVAVADTESMDKGIVPAFQHFLRGLPPHAERFPAELPLRPQARNHGQSLAPRRTYQFSPQPVAIACGEAAQIPHAPRLGGAGEGPRPGSMAP